MKNNKKGFTLAELLIVVAIIAVLVAIAIPVFTTQLEKSREATDMSNLRAAYAEVMAKYLANGAKNAESATVTAVQTKDGWEGSNGKLYTRVDGTSAEVTIEKYDETANFKWKVAVASNGTVTAKKKTD